MAMVRSIHRLVVVRFTSLRLHPSVSRLHTITSRSVMDMPICISTSTMENRNRFRTTRLYSDSALDDIQYDRISEETLESLSEFFDELCETMGLSGDYDVSYSQGVLTVKFGGPRGTYVINKQTPNKQLWLSSPTSGPKRYDYINGSWVYSREKRTLHKLLSAELTEMLGADINLDKCSYSGR